MKAFFTAILVAVALVQGSPRRGRPRGPPDAVFLVDSADSTCDDPTDEITDPELILGICDERNVGDELFACVDKGRGYGDEPKCHICELCLKDEDGNPPDIGRGRGKRSAQPGRSSEEFGGGSSSSEEDGGSGFGPPMDGGEEPPVPEGGANGRLTRRRNRRRNKRSPQEEESDEDSSEERGGGGRRRGGGGSRGGSRRGGGGGGRRGRPEMFISEDGTCDAENPEILDRHDMRDICADKALDDEVCICDEQGAEPLCFTCQMCPGRC